MSQIHKTVSSTPSVPTSFVTNSGTATPAANILNILGTTQLAGSIPVETTAPGASNTVDVIVQISQAIAASDATKIGLAAFNNAQFTVDANGFVSIIGGSNDISATLTTNDNSTQTLYSLALGATPATYVFQLYVIAYDVTDALSAGYKITHILRTTGAAGSTIGVPDNYIVEEGALVGTAVTTGPTANTFVLSVAGLVGKTIDWMVTGFYNKVT